MGVIVNRRSARIHPDFARFYRREDLLFLLYRIINLQHLPILSQPLLAFEIDKHDESNDGHEDENEDKIT